MCHGALETSGHAVRLFDLTTATLNDSPDAVPDLREADITSLNIENWQDRPNPSAAAQASERRKIASPASPCSTCTSPISASGHSRHIDDVRAMSAIPPLATIEQTFRIVEKCQKQTCRLSCGRSAYLVGKQMRD
jgi:hypothetical protein